MDPIRSDCRPNGIHWDDQPISAPPLGAPVPEVVPIGDGALPRLASGTCPSMKSLLFETGKVLIVGLVVAWLANRMSPRGLHLGRDYFSDPRLRVVSPESGGTESPATQGDAAEASHRVSEITSDQALEFFRESRRRPGEVIFVDARKESSFLEGHVPDAYPLDRFYPDTSLPAVVMAGGTAEVVVVYCAGGTCEDSHYAALQLLEAGLQESRVRVYAGGFNDWTAQHRPVERGVRGSGLITDPLP